jgi:hypothetical protein
MLYTLVVPLLFASICIATEESPAASAQQVAPTIKQYVIATDADGCILTFDFWYWAKLFAYYPYRAFWLMMNRNFVRDMKACMSPNGLYDKEGNRIIGGYATVDYFVKEYMPWATEADKARMRSVMAAVKPIDAVIDYYQSLDMPIVVWTNNDQVTYNVKMKTINALRTKAKKLPLYPNMEFVSIATGNPGANDKSNVKPNLEYYKKVYEDTCKFFGLQLGELKVFFVDDNPVFVEAARKAAKFYSLPIEAYWYAGSINALKESLNLDILMSIPAELQELGKELEEGLHTYEANLAVQH